MRCALLFAALAATCSPGCSLLIDYGTDPASRDGGDAGGAEFYRISGSVSGAIADGVLVTLGGNTAGTVTTAGGGLFSFSGLANGNYTLTPSKSGYTFSPASLSVTVNGANVGGQDFTSTLVASLYSISGTVNGATASGVTIALTGVATGSATTDAGGHYTLTGLANGNYTLTPSKSGYTFSPASLSVTVNGANVGGQDFTSTLVASLYSISGAVNGATASGVTIALTGVATGSATTDVGGHYTLTGLANGNYTLTPSKSGYTFSPASLSVTVNGANVGGQDFTSTVSLYGISGTVSGATASGVTVALTGAATGSATSDSGGHYALTGLANGSYTLTPGKSGYAFAPASLSVTVNGADVAGRDFIASATHTVTYDGNGATSGIAPVDPASYLPGATVMALDGGSLAKTGYAFSGWNTLANGTGTTYAAGASLTMGGVNVTLYAMWAPSITTVAGNGTQGYLGDGGPATSAELYFPWGIALDASDDFYFADNYNHRIRKVSASGTITTVAGNGTAGFSGDGGPAASAQVNGPTGVVVDASGNLFIADSYNKRVRKVSASGVITTIPGPWLEPMGVAVDSAGSLYVSDYFDQVWKVSTSGTITTVAGNGTQGYSGDGGPATSAMLHGPWGVAVDASGNVYIADQYNNRIRRVSANGTITTVAGNGTQGYSGDGGPATSAMISNPQGISVDASGNLYICDVSNSRIRKVSTSGTITTVAGNGSYGYSGDGGAATASSLGAPRGVAFDASGDLYIADSTNNRIRKVTSP